MDDEFIRAYQIKRVSPPQHDFRSEFWQQVPDMRPTVEREVPATFNRCVFDVNKRRVYHGNNCPHKPEGHSDDKA